MIRYILVAFSCLIILPWHHNAADRLDNLSWLSDNLVTANELTSAEEMDAFRLPSNVFPVSYELKVSTDFENLTYFGRIDIVVQATVKTCRIILNAKDVYVNEVEVIDQKLSVNLPIVDYYLVDKNEWLVIALNDTNACLISSRKYIVKVVFEASLRRDMTGFYKSSYKENDVKKWLAVTKFEPTFARKAFPCFDEPAFRTPFKISIRRRSDQISLSNMPLLNSTKNYQTNMVWDHFQETLPIPTYLVAFFVGEFYAMKTRFLAIYTHKSYINQARYMANKSLNLLEAMENITGIDYVLPKLDLLAIPDCIGAMENWGLNTYSERLLLLTDNSKMKSKEIVTTLVQHELSHLWFGDLVTIAWWDYLWMKEGFATYFQFFATKMVEPDWRLEDVFVYQVHQTALESDQIPMHAMSCSVQSPIQIKAMFDDISYDKAGAVLRMFHYTVTEENFKMALNYYLEHNQYNAVTPEQLWIAFENVLYNADFELDENVSVTEFMKSWTEQAGYPLVTVIKVNDTFIISQERFLVHPSNETDLTEWVIGLTYTTEDDKYFDDVLPKTWLKGTEMVLTNQTESGWFIFNIQSIGFFRVNYEADNWNALINQLNNDCSVIHVLNRAQLIDDTFNLARADKVDYTIVLRLSEYLKNEDDVVPWYSAMKGFEYLMNRMKRSPSDYKYIESYVSHLAGFIFMKTDNLVAIHNNTNYSIMASWNAFSNWACKLENSVCTSLALIYFELWYQGKKIPADIRDAAFCVGVKNSNSEVWYSILHVYMNSESASDRQSAQWALACSEDRNLLSKYLDFMFDGYEGPIRPQDFKVIYQTLATSPKGISVLIEFLTDKLDRIVNEIINGEQVASSIYSLLASRVALDEEISKMDDLRKSSSVPVYLQEKFNSSFSTIEYNLAWFHKYHHIVGEWSKTIVDKLGLDLVQSTNISTISWDTTSEMTSTEQPSLSSASTMNGQMFVLISLIISLKLVFC